MDALSQILEVIKHKGVVYDKINFSAPWGIDLPNDNNAQFWRLIKGRCYLTVPGEPTIHFQEGDLVLVPNGASHWIADSPISARVSAADFLKARDAGRHLFTGPGEKTIMIGGHFEFDNYPKHPFLNDLPKVIHINNLSADVNHWLAMTIDLIFNELDSEQPGSNTIINRLADVAFIHVIRAYLEKCPDTPGFLSALKDQRVSAALKVMQCSPDQNWTITGLSKHAGMSRSSFCTAFKEMIGETPMEYLTNWRILIAKELLRQGNVKISDVASRVGYQSEAAFSRMFKSKVYKTPSDYKLQR